MAETARSAFGPEAQGVLRQALALAEPERIRIARELISSLDEGDSDPDWEADWAREIDRRLDDVATGRVELVDAASALEEARRSLVSRKQS
jgi:putative addiction module component (TIGR02574 family)